MANAAIGNAQIGNAAITSAKIGTAEIATLNIQGEAVTVPRSASGTTSASLTLTTADFPTGTKFYTIATGNIQWANGNTGGTQNYAQLHVGGAVVNTGYCFVQGTSGGSSGSSVALANISTFSGANTVVTINSNSTFSNATLIIIGIKK